MVSMKDVAREAGVSLGTVSGVLNGKKTIKPENYRKVMEAVRKLNYQPNMLARSLRTKLSESIGLILPDIRNPYFPELVRGAEDAALQAGVTLFLCNSDRSGEKEWHYAQALVQKKVDGIIVVKPHMSREQLEQLRASCRLVLLDAADWIMRDFDLVNVDNHVGATRAVCLLLEYGHRDIAFISGRLNTQSMYDSMYDRLNSYKAVLAANNIPFRPEWVRECDYTWEGGRETARELLTAAGPRPTAIFVGNDIMALGAIRGIRDRGLRVPEDISVCGFDDIDIARMTIPALTTVHQPKYEIGVQSMKLLLEKIHGEVTEVVHKTLEPTVVLRDTVTMCQKAKCQPAAGTDPLSGPGRKEY